MPAIQLVDIETRLSIEDFLFAEARLLDERRFEEWVDLFTDDGHYEIPVRVTREASADWELAPTARIFDDTKQTLEIRVRRLRTDFAWAEQPPSRTRHFVTNVAAEPTDIAGEFVVWSNALVYRSRGEHPAADIISAQRRDRLRRTDVGWRFLHRWAALDQSNVNAHNLSIFI